MQNRRSQQRFRGAANPSRQMQERYRDQREYAGRTHRPEPREQQGYFRGQAGYGEAPHPDQGHWEEVHPAQRQQEDFRGREDYDEPQRRHEDEGRGGYGESRSDRDEPMRQGYGPGNWERGGYSNRPREYQRGERGEAPHFRSGPEPSYGYEERRFSRERENEGYPEGRMEDQPQHQRPYENGPNYEREPRSYRAEREMRPERSDRPYTQREDLRRAPQRVQLGGHWENELLERGGAYREEEYRPPRMSQARAPFGRSQQESRQLPGGRRDEQRRPTERYAEGRESEHSEAARQFAGLDDGNLGSEDSRGTRGGTRTRSLARSAPRATRAPQRPARRPSAPRKKSPARKRS